MAAPQPPETITAPASTPDRQGRPIPSIQIVQDIETGKNVPLGESTQFQRQQEAEQKLVNLEKAIAERPQIAGIRETLQSQIIQQAGGDFGERRVNLTPEEKRVQEIKDREQLAEMRFETGERFGDFATRVGEEAKESLFVRQRGELPKEQPTTSREKPRVIIDLEAARAQEVTQQAERQYLFETGKISEKEYLGEPALTYKEARFIPRGEGIYEPIPTPKTKLQRAEEKVSGFLKEQPIVQMAGFALGREKERVQKLQKKFEGAEPLTLQGQALGALKASEYIISKAQKPKELVTELAIARGAGYVFGAGLKGTELLATTKTGKQALRFVPFKPLATGTIKYGLPIAYGSVVTAEVALTPSEKKGEIFADEMLKLGAFISGAKAGQRGALKTSARIKEIQYEMALEKRFAESEGLPVLRERTIPQVELPKELSREFLVSELKGVKQKGVIKADDLLIRGAEMFEPIKSKPFYTSDFRQPDLILAQTKGKLKAEADIIGLGTGRTFYEDPFVSKLKSSPEELPVPKRKIKDISMDISGQKVITPKEALQFGIPRTRTALFESGRKEPTGLTETFLREQTTKFTPIELKYGELAKTKGKPARKAESDYLKEISGLTPKQLGVTYKLGGFKELFFETGGKRVSVRKDVPSGKITKQEQFIKPIISVTDSVTGRKVVVKGVSKRQPLEREIFGDTGLVLLQKLEEPKVRQKAKQQQVSKQKQTGIFLYEGDVKVRVKPEYQPSSLFAPLLKTEQKQRGKQKIKTEQKSKLLLFPELKSLQAQAQKQAQPVKQKQEQKLILISRLKPALEPKQDIYQKPKPKQDIFPLQDITPIQDLTPELDFPFREPPPEPRKPKKPPEPPPDKLFPPLFFPKDEFKEKKKLKKEKRKGKVKYFGTPSLSTVGLGNMAAGTYLTKKQLAGKEIINPFLLRKVSGLFPKRKKKSTSFFGL